MADGDGYFDLRNPGSGIPYNQNDNGFDMGMENSQRNYPPTTDPSTDQGNGGGNWLTNGLSNAFGNITNGISNGLSNPALIPSLAAAWNQYRDSDRYTSMAEKYADRLDPFGKQRAGYQTKLQNAYDDPASVLKDPAHTGIQNIEMDNIMRKLGASGGSTSNMGVSLADYLGKSDSQYLQQERQQLAELSGAQFGPGAAAHMLETGMQGSISSRNKALDALMYPFGKGSNGGNGGNGGGNGNGSSGGGNGAPRGTGPGGTMTPQDIQRYLGSGPAMGPASSWIQQQIRQGITVDPNDPHVQQAIQEMTPEGYYNGYRSDSGYDDWQRNNNDDIMNQYGGESRYDTPSGGNGFVDGPIPNYDFNSPPDYGSFNDFGPPSVDDNWDLGNMTDPFGDFDWGW